MKFRYAHLLSSAGLALGLLAPALAAPVPSALSITASVSLDTVNSFAPVGGASQSGSLSHSTSSPGSSSFTGLPGSLSPSSLSGGLLQTGDSFGASFSMSGSNPNGGTVQTDGLFADFVLNLANSSLTETFTLLFKVSTRNAVQASGPDAFAFSDFSLQDSSLAEIFFTDHRVDTANPGSGFELQSASDSFSIVLAPGASTTLTGLQRQRGGTFGNGPGSYSASLFTSIQLQDVDGSGGNNQIPLPGSLPLALLGLLSGAWALRRPLGRPSLHASATQERS